MKSADAALEEAKLFLREEVAPHAQEMDQSPEALARGLAGLCRRDLMALKRPAQYGGPEMPEPMFREYQEEIARRSGALAFLTTQHQSAVAMISRGENPALAAEYLPEMGDGRRLVGIGFSQLRRGGPPMMRAEEVEGGYRLDGEVPWITGGGFYPEFLIGAALPDGQAVFGVVPLTEQEDGSICISPPMRLAAMESANTVSATFRGFFLTRERTAFVRPPNWIRNNDQINVALQGHFALGCSQAGIDVVRLAGEKKSLAFLTEGADRLADELAECRRATTSAQQTADEQSTAEGLRARVWAIDLAVRCAHAAVAASSGAANSLAHPAQRIYREALVYTVSAQTLPIMEATIARLVNRGEALPTT
jgi:alkylation response protein AidB-like acyl-CoA dehydrogenase